jgi:glucosamine--fructose-6-phosphate aminotransferase (isomerizing)
MSATDERTRLEILDQPDSLRKTVDRELEELQRIAKKIEDKKCCRIFIVGMGSSYSAALMGKTLADRITTMPVEVYRGYEFEYQNPVSLSNPSCVILVSFSGETEDVVSALRFAKKHRAYTVSISGPEDNTLAREADDALRIVSRDTKAMIAAHLTQVALLYLLIGFLANYRQESTKVDELKSSLDILIKRLPAIIAEQEYNARQIAEQFKNESLFYVISGGPAYGVAYKLAMTEITENVWLHGLVQYSTEFRHGIVEKMEAGLPVIFLIGSDESQKDIRREMETCRKLNVKTIIWDSRDFPLTDEYLAPFYLSIPANWFVYHLALLRGKPPSSRRYMGSVIPYANMKSLSS